MERRKARAHGKDEGTLQKFKWHQKRPHFGLFQGAVFLLAPVHRLLLEGSLEEPQEKGGGTRGAKSRGSCSVLQDEPNQAGNCNSAFMDILEVGDKDKVPKQGQNAHLILQTLKILYFICAWWIADSESLTVI